MATYAAQIDCLDQNIGDLMSYLKKQNQLDNTIIMFTSDNGANHNTLGRNDNGGEIMVGSSNSWTSYGESWDKVSNYPLKYFKSYTHEGGTKAQLSVFNKACPARIDSQVINIMDLLPTIVECSLEVMIILNQMALALQIGFQTLNGFQILQKGRYIRKLWDIVQ